MMKVVYLAHPLSGPRKSDIRANLVKARTWVRHIEGAFKDIAIVANWIIECEIWDDGKLEERSMGLKRDMAILSRCDELWLVGSVISDGMRAEANHAEARAIPVLDLTGKSPDEVLPCQNGCVAPVQAPSKVICQECMDVIGAKIRSWAGL